MGEFFHTEGVVIFCSHVQSHQDQRPSAFNEVSWRGSDVSFSTRTTPEPLRGSREKQKHHRRLAALIVSNSFLLLPVRHLLLVAWHLLLLAYISPQWKTISSKKRVVTSATLVVTGALLVETMFAIRNKKLFVITAVENNQFQKKSSNKCHASSNRCLTSSNNVCY